jgi:uncharacterized SAM-binding protein YcdF (DUF218 family)
MHRRNSFEFRHGGAIVLTGLRKFNSYFSRSRMKILLGFILSGFILILFREQWLMLIGNFLIIEDPLKPADVIHVIAGEDYRTDYAIQLYKQGYGKTLFFTGGWCEFHEYNHGEHAEARSLAQGVALNAIAYDDSKVTSTYMEAEKLKVWIEHSPTPIRSVIIVSDPFHMRRARWTYMKVLGESIEVQMAPVPFELTPYHQVWWTDPDSQKYVRDEYEKIVYYVFRYQISGGKFKKWLVSLDRE